MRISVSCSRAALVSFRASSSSRSVVHRPSFGSGWTSRSYARDVSPDRSILRTVFRDTRRSRAICLIVLPLTKCSRRIRPIVSTVSIPPPPASNQSEQRIRRNWRGSILDADNPLQGVKIARRITCADGYGVQARLDAMELPRPRQWGACWLACQLYEQLELDRFWSARLPDSRKGTQWRHILQTLVCYRLIDPGSEWRLHRLWFEQSAMADLLGADYALVEKNALYRCLDKLLEHKTALFDHLRQRWQDLFGASFEVLLYDLTSTYFESAPPDDEDDKRRYGYSRDKRSDCVQVVIALIVTPEGFPLAYEVLPGNTADCKTLRGALRKIEAQYGKAQRIWVMDRGIPTEEVLMRLGAARSKARAEWRLIDVEVAPKAATFSFALNRDKLRQTRRREGRYLLRTNLCDRDPAHLWQFYIQLVEVEAAFKNLKDDLQLRPIYHQLEHRVEAHIFVAFLAYCLHVTLRAQLKPLAPGLTPRAVLYKLAAIQMLDVDFPTTAGRPLILSRYTELNAEQKLLVKQLKLDLPSQPPPRITAPAVKPAMAEPQPR